MIHGHARRAPAPRAPARAQDGRAAVAATPARTPVLCCALLCAGLLGLPACVLATDAQSMLGRVRQDQQFLQQQTQVAQTLLSVERSRMLNSQSEIRLLPSPRFELIRREASTGDGRIEQYRSELDRLSARARALEAQRRSLEHQQRTRALPPLDAP